MPVHLPAIRQSVNYQDNGIDNACSYISTRSPRIKSHRVHLVTSRVPVANLYPAQRKCSSDVLLRTSTAHQHSLRICMTGTCIHTALPVFFEQHIPLLAQPLHYCSWLHENYRITINILRAEFFLLYIRARACVCARAYYIYI